MVYKTRATVGPRHRLVERLRCIRTLVRGGRRTRRVRSDGLVSDMMMMLWRREQVRLNASCCCPSNSMLWSNSCWNEAAGVHQSTSAVIPEAILRMTFREVHIKCQVWRRSYPSRQSSLTVPRRCCLGWWLPPLHWRRMSRMNRQGRLPVHGRRSGHGRRSHVRIRNNPGVARRHVGIPTNVWVGDHEINHKVHAVHAVVNGLPGNRDDSLRRSREHNSWSRASVPSYLFGCRILWR
jgi:hypothetical protein